MPATRKRPPMEMEPGEGKKHEMGESPDEEVREGSDDMPKAKHSRKRGARGAKKTKAPMDGEGCACGGGKGKKCTCDGGCGSYKKMDSALTPHEYLAACELGIQGRSRNYIRSRLDSAQRFDLKCGKGSISQGEKCHKGAASKAQQQKSGLNKAQKTMLIGSAVAGGVGLALAARSFSSLRNPRTLRVTPPQRGTSGSGASNVESPMRTHEVTIRSRRGTERVLNSLNTIEEGRKRQGISSQSKLTNQVLGGPSLEDYGEAAKDPVKFNEMMSSDRKPPKRGVTKMRVRRQATGLRRPKRDSVYADGFAVDYAALVI